MRLISVFLVRFSCNVVTRQHSGLIRGNTYPLHCVQQSVYFDIFTTQRVEIKQRKLKISQSDQHFIFCLHPGTAAGFTTYTVSTNCLIAHVVPYIN